jgi:lipoprotein Spr/probable lipoprotein NlpC
MLRITCLFALAMVVLMTSCQKPNRRYRFQSVAVKKTNTPKKTVAKPKSEPAPATESSGESTSDEATFDTDYQRNTRKVSREMHDANINKALSYIYKKFPDTKQKCIAFKKNRLGKTIDISKVTAEKVIRIAQTYKGVPHSFGGLSRKGIDCSGLVAISFREAGVKDFPHGAEEQAYFGQIILEPSQLQRGDLIFFTGTYPTDNLITHVGIWLGNNRFIHAATSKGVTVTDFTDSAYWQKHYAFATRLFTHHQAEKDN